MKTVLSPRDSITDSVHEPMMGGLKRGIRGHDIQAHGLENICLSAKKQNIEYLQLVLEKSIDEFGTKKFTREYAELIKQQLGIMHVAILGSYINPSNPNDDELNADINKFKEKIKYASVLKPIAVGTETGIYKEGMTDSEEAYLRVLHTMQELTAYAKKYGVNIGIEGVHCFVINTPEKMRRLIDDLASDNVKVIFDPLNFLNINNYTNQNAIIETMFDLLADRICVLHAKDFIIQNGKFKSAVPTEGILNYKLILKKMKEYGLDIPIICEEISENDAAVAFNNLERIMKEI